MYVQWTALNYLLEEDGDGGWGWCLMGWCLMGVVLDYSPWGVTLHRRWWWWWLQIYLSFSSIRFTRFSSIRLTWFPSIRFTCFFLYSHHNIRFITHKCHRSCSLVYINKSHWLQKVDLPWSSIFWWYQFKPYIAVQSQVALYPRAA